MKHQMRTIEELLAMTDKQRIYKYFHNNHVNYYQRYIKAYYGEFMPVKRENKK